MNKPGYTAEASLGLREKDQGEAFGEYRAKALAVADQGGVIIPALACGDVWCDGRSMVTMYCGYDSHWHGHIRVPILIGTCSGAESGFI